MIDTDNDFTVFWLNGTKEIVFGPSPGTGIVSTIDSALHYCGYGSRAIYNIDFYETGNKLNDYTWNKNTRNWEPVE